MRYQQASRTHLIHPETFELVEELSEPQEIAAPFYLNMFRPENRVNWKGVICQIELVFKLSLNELEVEFENGQMYKKAYLDFRDDKTGHRVFMRLKVDTDTVVSYSGGSTDELFYGLEYKLDTAGYDPKFYRHDFDSDDWAKQNFCEIPDLGSQGVYRIGKNRFCMGISSRKWHLFYHGKEISHSCYALLCGTWAILLTDDLRFDSLVYLNGVVPGVLYMEKIAYTVNPYLVKVMTVIK